MPRLDYMLPMDPDRGNLRAKRRHHRARMRARALFIRIDKDPWSARTGFQNRTPRGHDDEHRSYIAKYADHITTHTWRYDRDWPDDRDLRQQNRWLRELAEYTSPDLATTTDIPLTSPPDDDTRGLPTFPTPDAPDDLPLNPIMTRAMLAYALLLAYADRARAHTHTHTVGA